MRSVLFITAIIGVMALAYWAYRENYRTQAALNQLQSYQHQIGATRARLGVLRAEWAYLNRPDRLRDLAELNYDRLNLAPMRPDQFGRVDEIAYPQGDDQPAFQSVDVVHRGAGE